MTNGRYRPYEVQAIAGKLHIQRQFCDRYEALIYAAYLRNMGYVTTQVIAYNRDGGTDWELSRNLTKQIRKYKAWPKPLQYSGVKRLKGVK